MAQQFNAKPDEEDDVRLEFTFHSRLESDGTAGTIYKMFRTLPEWVGTSVFHTTVGFEKGSEPRLEMPDLLAREAMKELDRKIINARPKARRSYRALRDAEMDGTKKFIFTEHDRVYCERWGDSMNQPESQVMLEEYEQWLAQTGRVQNGRQHDNMANRALFYTWLENREELPRRPDANPSA
jgi:hypothetical protein